MQWTNWSIGDFYKKLMAGRLSRFSPAAVPDTIMKAVTASFGRHNHDYSKTNNYNKDFKHVTHR